MEFLPPHQPYGKTPKMSEPKKEMYNTNIV